jgi:prephenate dehydrogenase
LSTHAPDVPSIAILGLGLIGGSLGIRLRSRGWRVSYVDPEVEEDKAIDLKAADRRLGSLGQSDDAVVMLAAPLDACLAAVGDAPPHTPATSVCGLMTPLLDAAGRRGLPFVAGHPMAGSEERSIEAARGDLFEGRRWFLSRGGGEHPLIGRLIEDAGASADEVEPVEHDRAMLLVSHLPQLLSTALAAHLSAEEIDLERFGGSGLRTFLRLAGSPASVWAPLFASARGELEPQLEAVRKSAEAILRGEGRPLFKRANDLWDPADGARR